MSATALQLPPAAVDIMATRRAPLASIPNAINSPNRGTKRSRAQIVDQRDLPFGQAPPAKRQHRDADDLRRHAMLKKSGPQTALQKKFEAAKPPRQSPQKASQRAQKPAEETLDTIRQWQQHYKKIFPKMVFYFESVADDARAKASRQIHALGAREEIFFSKVVTHVVTTRAIPSTNDSSSSAGVRSALQTDHQSDQNGQGRTINPLLLETQQHRARFTFDSAVLTRNTQGAQRDTRARTTSDILHKAQEMNMKIWTLEKLQRMMNTMFHTDTGEQAVLPATGRAPTSAGPIRQQMHVELSQLLQHEKIHSAVDREWMTDMVPFRGYYVYVHDMDEKTRPAMLRDYPRTETKEQGKWPQLRVTQSGRCPFLEDPAYRQRMLAEQREAEKAAKDPPRTRAASAAVHTGGTETTVLADNRNLAKQNTMPRQIAQAEISKPLDPPKSIPVKRGSTDTLPLFNSTQISRRPQPRYAGGEPVASGMQPSNITSAIKSQAISSTAAAPGLKAGSSKELNILKRKILVRNNGQTPNAMPNSYQNDVRAAINRDHGTVLTRGTKRKADTLAHIEEEDVIATDGEEQLRAKALIRKKKAIKEAKPGYCENCREKFDDFDTHIVGRKHRKFATTPDNWRELDDLLSRLVRPLKEN